MIYLVALDWRTARQSYELVRSQLDARTVVPELRVVLAESIGASNEVVVAEARSDRFPNQRMDPLSRIRRVIGENLLSRKLWRAVRIDGRLEHALSCSDLLVAADEASVRTVWHLARRKKVRGLARPTAVTYALDFGEAGSAREPR